MDSEDIDDRVADGDSVTLTRSREVSHVLVTEIYPSARSEQDAIRRLMSDCVEWHDKGITPDEMVRSLLAVLDTSEGDQVGIGEREFRVRVEEVRE